MGVKPCSSHCDLLELIDFICLPLSSSSPLLIRLFFRVIRLKITNNQRNNSLRKEIISRIAYSFLTDTERAETLMLPEGCRVRESAKIVCPQGLTIGPYCNLAENSVVDASGGLTIGSHTTIGVGVLVWSHSSHMANLLHSNYVGSSHIIRKKTTIGSGCFICGPSVVQAGSTIGDYCLIQPFSTVAGDVPDRSIVTPNGILAGVLTDEKVTLMSRMSSPSS